MALTAPLSLLRDVRLARLVRRSQRGDRVAFQELYRALYPVVSGFIHRRVRRPADAEDLVAQVFFRLLESLDRLDADRPVFAYVLSIARNLVTDAARRPVVLPALDAEAVRDVDPLKSLIVAQDVRAVREAVARLPEDTQELLHLRFGEELRFAEIAQVLGLKEEAVRQRISRAVRALRTRAELGAGEVANEG